VPELKFGYAGVDGRSRSHGAREALVTLGVADLGI
jgi:hypothetical protein